MLLELLLAVLDEIGRNGFKKIVIVNGHGGNSSFIPFLTQCMLERERTYTVYHYDYYNEPELAEFLKELADSGNYDGHGGEIETSHLMANEPSLVRMDLEKNIKDDQKRLKRWEKIPRKTSSPIWFYAYAPEHYEGMNSEAATAEKGHKFQEWCAQHTARFIKAVKDDTVAPMLTKEFYQRMKNMGKE